MVESAQHSEPTGRIGRPIYAELLADRLARAARLAGAFGLGPEDELAKLLAELVDDFGGYQQDVERRIATARRGTLPDGLEDALHPLQACVEILIAAQREGGGRFTAEDVRRNDRAMAYLCDRLEADFAAFYEALYGPDPESDGDDHEDREAA